MLMQAFGTLRRPQPRVLQARAWTLSKPCRVAQLQQCSPDHPLRVATLLAPTLLGPAAVDLADRNADR